MPRERLRKCTDLRENFESGLTTALSRSLDDDDFAPLRLDRRGPNFMSRSVNKDSQEIPIQMGPFSLVAEVANWEVVPKRESKRSPAVGKPSSTGGIWKYSAQGLVSAFR